MREGLGFEYTLNRDRFMKIEVVYFAYLMKEWDILFEQLDYFKGTELYNSANKLNLCCTISKEKESALRDIISNKYSKWSISNVSYENTFEYPGISYLHKIAQEDTYYLYMHTKGIFYFFPHNVKLRKLMHDKLIKDYKNCMGYLDEDYDKVTCYKSHGGFCWFNFLWVKGTFIKRLSLPSGDDIKNRFFYEEWFKGDVSKVKSLVIEVPTFPPEVFKSVGAL